MTLPMPVARVAIVVAEEHPALSATADTLAKRLRLPIVDNDRHLAPLFDTLLVVSTDGLTLRQPGRDRTRAFSDFRVDFLSGKSSARWSAPGFRQPLAAAMGLRTGVRTVVDATAGFGFDAFQLASLGCRVTAIERHPVIAIMLEDALARARNVSQEHWLAYNQWHRKVAPAQLRNAPRHAPSDTPGNARAAQIAGRITLSLADARDVLAQTTGDRRPDAVYLDPMYQPRGKSTLVRKQMRLCRSLVGEDSDAAELFDAARDVALRRVVVKRHRKAAPLCCDPSLSFQGATVRYDVYVGAQLRR